MDDWPPPLASPVGAIFFGLALIAATGPYPQSCYYFAAGLVGAIMKLVLEYERHAAECREIAGETTNPRFKKQLEYMAEVWERLAAQRRRGIIERESNSV